MFLEDFDYQQKERLVNKAVDNAFIIIITDISGNLIYANNNFTTLTGYNNTELFENGYRLDATYKTPGFFTEISHAITLAGKWMGEIKNRAKDGSFFLLNAVAVALPAKNTEATHYVFYCTDITHLNRQDEITKLKKSLTEATIQLEITGNDLEEFSHYISHDLRAPLRAVNGFALVLKEEYEEILGAEGQRLIETIVSGTKKMNQLIEDLLGFSRLGKKSLSVEPVDMKTIVRDCLNELLTPEQIAGFELHIADLPVCNGDVTMLRQVWLHLLMNSIKFSSKKEYPSIEVGFVPDDQMHIYFVKDKGSGFDMEYSHKLFGIFQRLHHDAEFEGRGVGLAFVKRVMLRHAGNVWAESAPNKGATFYFSIPR